jgi:hypothetical protein
MPPRMAPIGPDPWSEEEVVASMTYKILAQFNTPKDINVTVSNSLWPNIPGLPPTVIGKIGGQGFGVGVGGQGFRCSERLSVWRTGGIRFSGVCSPRSRRITLRSRDRR